MRMSKISGQFRQVAFDIDTRGIPAQQRAYCKTVSKIMQVWPFRSRWPTQTNLPRSPQELTFCGYRAWTPAVIQDEEARNLSLRIELIPLTPIDPEPLLSGDMNWNQTRLSPFTFTNRQHALVQIDVFFIQVQALAQTHPRGAEQANQSSIGFRSDPLRRVRCRDCFEKLLNLIRCVNGLNLAKPEISAK
jgi:hypothetical protein